MILQGGKTSYQTICPANRNSPLWCTFMIQNNQISTTECGAAKKLQFLWIFAFGAILGAQFLRLFCISFCGFLISFFLSSCNYVWVCMFISATWLFQIVLVYVEKLDTPGYNLVQICIVNLVSTFVFRYIMYV